MRIRCRIGLHKWSGWETTRDYESSRRAMWDSDELALALKCLLLAFGPDRDEQRHCDVCGLTQERAV